MSAVKRLLSGEHNEQIRATATAIKTFAEGLQALADVVVDVVNKHTPPAIESTKNQGGEVQ